VDIFIQTFRPGDYLLLCSDGLWEMLREESSLAQIILDSPTTNQACRSLVEAANAAGGEDNIGIVVVKVY
jgi:protein phosphatase